MTHYDILNIKKNANENDIKRAYKKLALKHHPDRGGDKEKFQEIQRAYDVLNNQETREEYDNKLNGTNRTSFFETFFNQMNRPKQKQKGPDIRFDLHITLENSFIGTTKKIKINRKIICSTCDGNCTTLEENKKTCTKCEGTGSISHLRNIGIMQIIQQQPCYFCKQKGYIINTEDECTTCSGNGTISKVELLEIPLRKGCQDGEIIVFQGMADETPNMIPGDLLIYINIETHPIYTRKENDLYITKQLTLYEALSGYDFTIKQLDQTNLRIQHFGITQPETISEINNKGMPIINSDKRGKLIIHFKVILSENIPTNIIDMLKNYK